jgi:hypothetical protein
VTAVEPPVKLQLMRSDEDDVAEATRLVMLMGGAPDVLDDEETSVVRNVPGAVWVNPWRSLATTQNR